MSLTGLFSDDISEELKYDAESVVICHDALSNALVPISPLATGDCAICSRQLSSQVSVQISKCHHAFHRSCVEGCLQSEPNCRSCRVPLGEPRGKCPNGAMTVKSSTRHCPGFSPSTTCIVITYDIPSGKQNSLHDNPGCEYKGTKRKAFVPNTQEGRQLLRHLKHAFLRGLTFSVNRSITPGETNVVTWSSIPHKTSLQGGLHGFPDSHYIFNCNASLDARNVPKFNDSHKDTSLPLPLLPVPSEQEILSPTLFSALENSATRGRSNNGILLPPAETPVTSGDACSKRQY